MTWVQSTVTKVKCDERDHLGDPVFDVVTGYAVSAMDGLKASGWHFDASQNRHICAECVAIRKAKAWPHRRT